MKFDQFKLRPELLDGLATLGFSSPTPVQQSAIPLVLEGKDAIIQAKTGSGKTLAFGLPILSLLEPQTKPQALVVVPTRELAIQVSESIAAVSPKSALRVLPIYGGVGLGPQEAALRKGIDLVVGTPGRLKDLMGRGSLDLSRVRILVLDEADQMLDMGFRRDIEFLLGRLPSRQQTLIFSATMPEAIEAIARTHLKNPSVVKLVQAESTPSEISHYFVRLKTDQRVDALLTMLEQERPDRAIVFVKMKHETKRLAQKLERLGGIKAGFLNGNMSQNARNTMMERFRAGELSCLVATDVAARGLDIEGLSHVFHFSVPTVVETYIHRSGRTGRAGNEGKTIIMVTPEDDAEFRAITRKVPFTKMELSIVSRGDNEPLSPPLPMRRGERPQRASKPANWRKFRVRLPQGHSYTRESFHQWIAKQVGLPYSGFRSIVISHDQATVEVEDRNADRFLQGLKRKSRA